MPVLARLSASGALFPALGFRLLALGSARTANCTRQISNKFGRRRACNKRRGGSRSTSWRSGWHKNSAKAARDSSSIFTPYPPLSSPHSTFPPCFCKRFSRRSPPATQHNNEMGNYSARLSSARNVSYNIHYMPLQQQLRLQLFCLMSAKYA